MTTQPRKEHLLEVSLRLFNEHGYHATGIDWILRESGVSKATLYKYFPSKEALILEVLQRRHQQLEERFKQALADAADQEHPALVLFDVLTEWFNSNAFFGCNFIKASGEYPVANDDIHRYAGWHKDSIKQLIIEATHIGNRQEKESIADVLVLLMDGAIVSAQVRGDKNAALKAKGIAEQLLDKGLCR